MADPALPIAGFVALRNSYQEEPEENKASFTPEVGEPIERRRSAISSDVASFQVRWNMADYATWKTFYKDTLGDGVLPFTATDPLTGVAATRFKCVEKYKLIGVKVLDAIVQLKLRRMP